MNEPLWSLLEEIVTSIGRSEIGTPTAILPGGDHLANQYPSVEIKIHKLLCIACFSINILSWWNF